MNIPSAGSAEESSADGQFGAASALSTILLAATGLAVFVVFRISDRKEAAFIRWVRPDL